MTAPAEMFAKGLRLVAFLAFLAAALVAYQHSRLGYLRENDVAAASALKPGDPLALAGSVAARLEAGAPAVLTKPEQAALKVALLTRPLSPELLGIWGLHLEARRENAKAAEAMRLANRASRHGRIAALWSIEAASAANDVPATLRHYHAALATNPELGAILLPVLAKAIAFPEIREKLKPYLAQPASWSAGFLDAAATTSSPQDLTALLTPLPTSLRAEAYEAVLGRILARIAAENGGQSVDRFAAALIPGFKPGTLRQLEVSVDTLDPRLGSLAWVFPENDGLAVETEDSGSMVVTAQPLARGVAAVRDLVVTPGGRYVFSQRIELGLDLGEVRASWTATCVGKGQAASFWEKQIPAGRSSADQSTLLEIPGDCSSVRFTLAVEGPDGQSPGSLVVRELALTPAA